MLTSASFCKNPRFAHSARQEHLPQGIIDLVGAGVVEVFPLEPEARTTIRALVVLREPAGLVEGGGPTHVGAQQVVQLGCECRILPGLSGRLLQFLQGGNQGFWHVLPAKTPIATPIIGTRCRG